MLDTARVREIADKAAKEHLNRKNVAEVRVEPSVDSQGHDALKIMIVIQTHALEKLKGDAVLDTLVSIHDQLQEAGDDRFPIIEYATADELENGVDP